MLVSCVPRPIRFDPVTHINPNRPHLFPPGVYYHRIIVTDSKGKKREFKGILKLEKESLNLVGLSRFDTTFFKLSEDLNAQNPKSVVYKFYYPVPKSFEEKFIFFYHSLKKIVTLPLKESPSSKKMDILLSHYDENKIPRMMEIKQKNFSVLILLENYQVSP